MIQWLRLVFLHFYLSVLSTHERSWRLETRSSHREESKFCFRRSCYLPLVSSFSSVDPIRLLDPGGCDRSPNLLSICHLIAQDRKIIGGAICEVTPTRDILDNTQLFNSVLFDRN